MHRSAQVAPLDDTVGSAALLSFEGFYVAKRDEIGRVLALTLGDAALGFEAVDEAMARAYERWGDISAGPNPSGWVYRTGLNWARSWLRRRNRGPIADQTEGVDGSRVEGFDVDLADALAELSDKHRAVVVLRYYLDWTVDQIADALEVQAGTVKSRLNRALVQLAGRLGGDSVGEEKS